MLLVSGWSRMVPQCGQKAGPVDVALEAKNSVDMAAVQRRTNVSMVAFQPIIMVGGDSSTICGTSAMVELKLLGTRMQSTLIVQPRPLQLCICSDSREPLAPRKVTTLLRVLRG